MNESRIQMGHRFIELVRCARHMKQGFESGPLSNMKLFHPQGVRRWWLISVSLSISAEIICRGGNLFSGDAKAADNARDNARDNAKVRQQLGQYGFDRFAKQEEKKKAR